MNIVFTTGNHI